MSGFTRIPKCVACSRNDINVRGSKGSSSSGKNKLNQSAQSAHISNSAFSSGLLLLYLEKERENYEFVLSQTGNQNSDSSFTYSYGIMYGSEITAFPSMACCGASGDATENQS